MVSDGYSNLKWIGLMWGLNTNKILEEGYWKYIIILHNCNMRMVSDGYTNSNA